jgi:hypothetical protein
VLDKGGRRIAATESGVGEAGRLSATMSVTALRNTTLPRTAIAARLMKSTKMLLSRVMGQPLKLQPVMRCFGHLAAITAMGLAAGLMAVPLDAAPQRLVPVPRPRPVTLGAQSSAPPAAASQNRDQKQPSQTDDAAGGDEACLTRLRDANIRFDIPTMPVAAKASCAIEVPVRLKSITTRARAVTEVHLPEEPIVSCQFAERLTAWLGHLVAPLIAGRMSTDLRAVRTGPGYECRNRNGAATGKLSAHALGKAIDISAFELSSGKLIPIKPDGDEAMRDVVDSVRTAACGWFTTVLGPGSDAAHTDHMHVDTALHGTSDRYRICQ